MPNLVLYRKYRPQNFSEIIGQEHVVQTLTNAISSGMISHAYLFSGPKGSGKTTVARLLAKAVNCENLSDSEPCNKCSSCKEIVAGNAVDLIEIDAASHRGIDEIRDLREGIRFSPVRLKYKVFVIDECHQLTKDAANALLKTLEEPPAHAIFILATTEPQKMIPTIISRCQRFDFRRLKVPEIIEKLQLISKKEKIKFEKEALSLIAINSRGSFRDAESLMDKCISFSGKKDIITTEDVKQLLGIVETKEVSRLIDSISEKNSKEALISLNKTIENGVDIQEFTKALIHYLRQSLLFKINPDSQDSIFSGLTKEELKKLKEQGKKFEIEDIQEILDLFLEAEGKIRYASIPQLPLEMAIIESCQSN